MTHAEIIAQALTDGLPLVILAFVPLVLEFFSPTPIDQEVTTP